VAIKISGRYLSHLVLSWAVPSGVAYTHIGISGAQLCCMPLGHAVVVVCRVWYVAGRDRPHPPLWQPPTDLVARWCHVCGQIMHHHTSAQDAPQQPTQNDPHSFVVACTFPACGCTRLVSERHHLLLHTTGMRYLAPAHTCTYGWLCLFGHTWLGMSDLWPWVSAWHCSDELLVTLSTAVPLEGSICQSIVPCLPECMFEDTYLYLVMRSPARVRAELAQNLQVGVPSIVQLGTLIIFGHNHSGCVKVF
jgi:hypothetical protein